MLEILAPFKDELAAQEALVRQALAATGHTASPSVAEDWNSLQKYIRPALVLLTSRLYQHRPEAAVPLAAVHQFIYLAGRVHTGVAEECTALRREAAQSYQFPVLVGDYLYGRFFTTLCDAGQNHLLGDLARVICSMNEGGMMRAKNALGQAGYDVTEIIRLETAELIASCCRLGGLAGGASDQEARHLYALGLELGMAIGRMEQGCSFSEAAIHLQRAVNEMSVAFCRRWVPGHPPGAGQGGWDQLERFIRLFLAPGPGIPTEAGPAGVMAG
jgi:geranylgeranyl pyrophosphate synthase